MQAIIVGGSGGIGNAFVQYLNEHSDFDIISTYSRHQPETKIPSVNYQQLDITEESAVESFCKSIDDLGLFINAAGFLHTDQFSPEKSTRHINKDYFMEVWQSMHCQPCCSQDTWFRNFVTKSRLCLPRYLPG